MIIDTCAMINNPEIFEYIADDEYVRIPRMVADELSKIKDRKHYAYTEEDTPKIARKLAHIIDDDLNKVFNVREIDRFLVEPAHMELIEKAGDLDAAVPDNQILSVALYHGEDDTTLVTDDIAFRDVIAGTPNIRCMTSRDYIESHKHCYRSQRDRESDAAREKIRRIAAGSKASTSAGKKESPVMGNTLRVEKLSDYGVQFSVPALRVLKNNKINTIEQFLNLTQEKVSALKVTSKEFGARAEISRELSRKEELLKKIRDAKSST